ncbi:MAG: glycosyltransferase, partial [Candidatus Thorarchaeota archaeon]|nr:glycosyltransferase [Candidatus Thorarchaeota archaeon]
VPIKMYEYMASGKPVIATNLPGLMKEFGNDSGIIYIETPEELIPKALKLIQDKDLESAGAKARRSVESNDWNGIVTQFQEVIVDAIEHQ